MPMRRLLPMILIASLLTGCEPPPPSRGDAEPGNVQALPGAGEDVGRTVIYRDRWGIPHIYAPTVEDGLYAQGWAQAQDRPEQLLMNLKMAMGEFTEVAGAEGLPVSLASVMFGHLRNGEAAIAALEPERRRRIEAYANGISDFYAAHPEDVPGWWQHGAVTPAMVDAFGRMFLYNWSIDEALGDLRRGGLEPQLVTAQRASNQWAISPSRSASGHAILLIDPHLSWWGPSRFWEFRIHAGALVGSGVGLAGSPYIGLGHNEHLAWAMTTGGPDTADVFRVTVDPEDPRRYRYDDGWRTIEQHDVTLAMPDGSSQHFTWESTDRGPVVARDAEHAYIAAIAYDASADRNAAWEALNFATDYRGAVAACATLSMFPQNVMVADTSGNIWYQRTGRVPVRDPAYDWSRPVDGSTSATAWQGFHPASDHLQVLNPEPGYLQNCNIPPDAMTLDSPFSLDAQADYLFSSAAHGPSFDGWINQRGARALELLAADDSVTVEEALAWAVDVQPFGHDRWIEALRRAGADDSEELADLLAWNGQLDRASTGALKYAYWRLALDGRPEAADLRVAIDDHLWIVENRAPRPVELDDTQLAAMRSAFESAMSRLREEFGRTDVEYGEVFRVGRGDASWPVGGGRDDRLGLTTLRTMGYEAPDAAHQRLGMRGQTSTQLVVLSDPIQSWIYLPVGQSDRPDSPHYRDQAAGPFSERQLRPSWWRPEDLAGNIVSRTELTPRH